MADNYLEKKMEDYRRGNHNGLSRRRGSTMLSNVPVLPLQSQRIALVVKDRGVTESLLVAFQQIGGLKVAFMGSDYKEGNLLAQKYGALFVGGSATVHDSIDGLLAQTSRRWGGIDAVVTDNEAYLNGVVEKQVLISFDTMQIQNEKDSRDVNAPTDIIRVVAPCEGFSVDAIAKAVVVLLTTPPKLISKLILSPHSPQD